MSVPDPPVSRGLTVHAWPGPDHTNPALDDIVGVGTPEHGWLGKAFILAVYAGLTGPALLLYYLVAWPWQSVGITVLTLAMVCGSAAAIIAFARGVERFRDWAWYVGMFVLITSVFGGAGAVAQMIEKQSFDDAVGAIARIVLRGLSIPMALVWIAYFWSRRADFGPARR